MTGIAVRIDETEIVTGMNGEIVTIEEIPATGMTRTAIPGTANPDRPGMSISGNARPFSAVACSA
ncbi:MAG: hypothetical protein ACP5R6_07720 [Chlorobaculum sp.]